jgi:hypothetical protein
LKPGWLGLLDYFESIYAFYHAPPELIRKRISSSPS